MIMIAVNNSTGSTGSLRVSRGENKENQMGCLVRDGRERNRRRQITEKKTYPAPGALSWDARHRSTRFLLGAEKSGIQTVELLWGFSKQKHVEKENKRDKSGKTSVQART